MARTPITPVPSELPPGAKGILPAFDGDPFVVTLPLGVADGAAPDSAQVLAQLVTPTLRALTFDRGPNAIAATTPAGFAEVPTDLAGVAFRLDYELNAGLESASQTPAEADCVVTSIVARKVYLPYVRFEDGRRDFSPSSFFRVPAAIPVTSGSPDAGTSTLAFRPDHRTNLVTCTYVGSSAEPPSYKLSSCNDGSVAGDAFFINYLELHVVHGNPAAGPTAVQLDLTCGELRPAAAARPAVDAFLGRAAPPRSSRRR